MKSILFVGIIAALAIAATITITTILGIQSVYAPRTCPTCASPFAPGQDESRFNDDDKQSARDFAPGQQAVGNPDERPNDFAPGHEKKVTRGE